MHFLLMIVFAVAVGVVFGCVGRTTWRERLRYGAKVFAEFMLVGLLLGWLLYFVPS